MKAARIAIACTLLGGCAVTATKPAPERATAVAPAPAGRAVETLTEEGLQYVARGDFEGARKRFAMILKLDPANVQGHFLMAQLQHRGANGGERLATDLAEVGYQRALQFDPMFWPAAYELGRLYLVARRFDDAQAMFAQAAVLRPGDAATFNELAVASYYRGDRPTAVAAIAEAKRLAPSERAYLRTEAFVAASVGDRERARAAATSLGAGHMPDWQRVDRRLGEWDAFHRAGVPLLVADNDDDNTGTAGQIVPPLKRIKPPSDNKAPRMVQVDVVLVRTEEVEGSRRGLNLLDSLQVQLGGSRQSTATRNQAGQGAVETAQRILTRTLTLPDITYVLNIANDAIDYASVVARPSLVALDGQPATFFSGEEVSLALSGNFAGNIQDKNIGVSLAVTPTFIGADSVLLAVSASRSFINTGNPSATGTFSQSLQTTKQSVTTAVAMKFGETLVLGGLSERQSERQRSATPLLGDVPLVQYLFNATQNLEYTKSVLMLLTPRAVSPIDERGQAPAPVAGEDGKAKLALRQLYERMPAVFRGPVDADALAHSLRNNTVVAPMRVGDLPVQPSAGELEPSSFSSRLKTLLYY